MFPSLCQEWIRDAAQSLTFGKGSDKIPSEINMQVSKLETHN